MKTLSRIRDAANIIANNSIVPITSERSPARVVLPPNMQTISYVTKKTAASSTNLMKTFMALSAIASSSGDTGPCIG